MSAGDCKRCHGDGILDYAGDVSLCPSCDGTGKAGYRRLCTRIKSFFRRV